LAYRALTKTSLAQERVMPHSCSHSMPTMRIDEFLILT